MVSLSPLNITIVCADPDHSSASIFFFLSAYLTFFARMCKAEEPPNWYLFLLFLLFTYFCFSTLKMMFPKSKLDHYSASQELGRPSRITIKCTKDSVWSGSSFSSFTASFIIHSLKDLVRLNWVCLFLNTLTSFLVSGPSPLLTVSTSDHCSSLHIIRCYPILTMYSFQRYYDDTSLLHWDYSLENLLDLSFNCLSVTSRI